jgi:dipeptidase E
MRLFLSSFRAGKHAKELIKLVGSGTEFAYISNAKDYKNSGDRKAKIKENLDYWRSIGLKPVEVDLRPNFHKSGAEGLLKNYGFIWLGGGNAFLLRRALSYTGADRYLYDAVRKNEVILGGESAGAIITGPTLRFSEVENDMEDSQFYTPEPYLKNVIWEGLNLVDFVPVPHFDSPGYVGIDEYVDNLEKEKIPYKKMTDEHAILINGDKEEFLS